MSARRTSIASPPRGCSSPRCAPTHGVLAVARGIAHGPLCRPGRACRASSARSRQTRGAIFDPAVPTLADELRQAGLSHRDRRQVAPGTRVAEHAQRTRLRFLPRLPRRHDGQLHSRICATARTTCAAMRRSSTPPGTRPTCSPTGPCEYLRERAPAARSAVLPLPGLQRAAFPDRAAGRVAGQGQAARAAPERGAGQERRASSSTSTTASAACWRPFRESGLDRNDRRRLHGRQRRFAAARAEQRSVARRQTEPLRRRACASRS